MSPLPVYYEIGFLPCITRMRNMIIAITRSMWMKLPRIWKPKNPSNQRITSIVAIVVSMI